MAAPAHLVPEFAYPCNPIIPAPPPCTAYLIFRSAPPLYSSALSVSYLLNASVSAVMAANNITTTAVSPIPHMHMISVPVPCYCSSRGYYLHNKTYILQPGDTFWTVTQFLLQGLSFYEAVEDQNPNIDPVNLTTNTPVTVPLRCACPSAEQAAAGVRYLVTYMGEEDEHAVARRFRIGLRALRDANRFRLQQFRMFNDDSNRTMLVPLKNPPSPDMLGPWDPAAAAAGPAPPPVVVLGSHCWPGSLSRRMWIDVVAVGSGCGALVSAGTVALSLLVRRCRRRRWRLGGTTLLGEEEAPPLLVAAVRDAVDSLTAYTYSELDRATAGFAEERMVSTGTSVYRAVINGQAFAVKRVAGRDVRGEVGVLARVNHSCLIRLSGICAHRGDTYLVLEFAENGALTGLLHGGSAVAACLLNWKQRVQVACDVASGLNYLHHFTNPPYVHKNLNSGNVLLDAKFRAKLSNFGLARAVAVAAGTDGGVGVQATRHVVGTHGYLAPEYLGRGLISTQMDVFAFGVILLELLSGKEAAFVAADGHTSLLWEAAEGVVDGYEAWFRLKEFMDPRLQGHYPFGLAFTMAALALRCVAREPRARPSMVEVLVLVSTVHDSTVDWDPQNYGVSDSMFLGR
ncbi:hypothetical protein U9M48_026928 [Paspalum notatum var. saurae]|uniref:Protein kinase domain-containing protein n=1 Tax=Paspalum notatum var. saurae TaxID=547442 RepID=A0AAQ3TYF9_PASNO